MPSGNTRGIDFGALNPPPPPLDHWIFTEAYDKVLVGDSDYRVLASAPGFLDEQLRREKNWTAKQIARSRGEAALAASQAATAAGQSQQEAQGGAMQSSAAYAATFAQAFGEESEKARGDAARAVVGVSRGSLNPIGWLGIGVVALGVGYMVFRRSHK